MESRSFIDYFLVFVFVAVVGGTVFQAADAAFTERFQTTAVVMGGDWDTTNGALEIRVDGRFSTCIVSEWDYYAHRGDEEITAVLSQGRITGRLYCHKVEKWKR